MALPRLSGLQRAAFGFNQPLSHQLQRDAIALAMSGFAFTFDGAADGAGRGTGDLWERRRRPR